MQILRVCISFLAVIAQLEVLVPHVSAQGPSGVVISQVYPGASGVAAQEYIELYNNSATDINVTNWCITYISSTGTTSTKLGCLAAPDSQTSLWVKATGYITFVSNEYKTAFPNVVADNYFTGGISATAGHIKLTDATNTEVDRLGWGTAVSPETAAATSPANGKSLQRSSLSGTLQDTDNNAADFVQATPTSHSSNVYEVVTIIDLCANIPDAQPIVPFGYASDENGNCQPDSCVNISGLQVSIPDGYESDTAGNCIQHDECDNLAGIQTAIPDTMVRADGNNCEWDLQPLQITEVLPNADGADAGNEFIEVYNPTDHMIDLSIYSVAVGVNGDRTYAFPAGATVGPGEYRSFSDSMMKFTLVNTTGRVILHAADGSTLGDTGVYDSPADGESWAFIDGSWQYTNQPTPGAENQPSIIQNSDENPGSEPAFCPAGKYRNPLTNRCRTIATDAAVLVSCDSDHYRNPETGRCKKIDSTSLAQCKDGQYRSPETNRCRNIATASAQKPCKDNQYRSETTNRCRNLPASGVPDAAFAVQPVKDKAVVFAGWAALGGVGVLALGYAGWEWRSEVVGKVRRIVSNIKRS